MQSFRSSNIAELEIIFRKNYDTTTIQEVAKNVSDDVVVLLLEYILTRYQESEMA